ncbi:fluoride efflux transporter CrcB [Candidatus Chloroploca sp. M-50]|uniref:Fluoride-specific ion channel FluC n=1 Tax=Candidatus Chloroploca mongolica TaxID=2528176 RepID=A0ABS4DC40_9CHLR|nr:fluoride efflux transporter CrcB [Candidatus Chloroploca mongolica]MBP1467013.1 fluoride efflux transporter CrcB [Candidatus Chloroploca mongolica]
MSYLLLGLGAIVGALSRYHLVRAMQARYGSTFPVGTFVVNLSGSLLLGILAGLIATHPDWPIRSLQALAGVGFCATYTTFSSFIFETVQLWRQGNQRSAIFNLCGQPILGFGFAWLGIFLGSV